MTSSKSEQSSSKIKFKVEFELNSETHPDIVEKLINDPLGKNRTFPKLRIDELVLVELTRTCTSEINAVLMPNGEIKLIDNV